MSLLLPGVARVKRSQHLELNPVQFKPVNWQPQVEVTFTRDVNGWSDRERRIKWHFASGTTHMVDEQHAVEFIVKGYATGTLPRHVSEDEKADIRSVITVIGMGGRAPTRTGH